MNPIKQRCLDAIAKPFGQHTVDDLCSKIVYSNDGTVTYYHGQEEFTEPANDAREAIAARDQILRLYPPI